MNVQELYLDEFVFTT